VPLYRLARAGQTIERDARPVRISSLDAAWTSPNRLRFAVTCSRGTYVRVLACDLGRALGTCAHLDTLRRTACGAFEIASAVRLDDLETAAVGNHLPFLSPAAALGALRAVVVDDRTTISIRRGQQWALETLGRPQDAGEVVRVADQGGSLVAIVTATADAQAWQLARVFVGGTLHPEIVE
jgi:tRNA pseudouridine55 synthase